MTANAAPGARNTGACPVKTGLLSLRAEVAQKKSYFCKKTLDILEEICIMELQKNNGIMVVQSIKANHLKKWGAKPWV
jgi:hypothetical protein